jgi:hypothetical protein
MESGLGECLDEIEIESELTHFHCSYIIYASLFNMIDHPSLVILVHSAGDSERKEYIGLAGVVGKALKATA